MGRKSLVLTIDSWTDKRINGELCVMEPHERHPNRLKWKLNDPFLLVWYASLDINWTHTNVHDEFLSRSDLRAHLTRVCDETSVVSSVGSTVNVEQHMWHRPGRLRLLWITPTDAELGGRWDANLRRHIIMTRGRCDRAGAVPPLPPLPPAPTRVITIFHQHSTRPPRTTSTTLRRRIPRLPASASARATRRRRPGRTGGPERETANEHTPFVIDARLEERPRQPVQQRQQQQQPRKSLSSCELQPHPTAAATAFTAVHFLQFL